MKIQNNFGGRSFSFRKVSIVDVKKYVLKLTSENIPAWVLQSSADTLSPCIKQYVDNMMHTCIFPSPLKSAEIRPIHKNEDVTDKGNYRPISLLPLCQ